jgi:hypothetical protein
MPTRKQRRREQKSKRHEYEFVYVDSEGNEVDDAPEDAVEPKKDRDERRNGAAKPAQKAAQSRGRSQGRPLRQPPPPSWNRAIKRGLLLGGVIFALFALTAKNHSAGALLAIPYALLFIPFTYYIDRFAYRRFQARTAAGGTPAKKKS